MDSKDIRSLQEAYQEVYQELDEGYKRFPYKKVEDKIHKKEADNPTGRGTPQSTKMSKVFHHFKGGKEISRTEKREHSPKMSKTKESENRERGNQNEELELYNLILSHLLDEGYATTEESAEVILENMSDDWLESIVEAFVDPESGEAPSGRSPVENVSYHPKKSVRRKAMGAFAHQMGKEYGGKWKAKRKDPTEG